MSKTPEELAQEYVIGEFPDTNSDMFLAAESVHKAFIAGYKAAQQQYREAVEVLDKHKAAAEKAVTNIKNASDWVTIEKAKANENT